MKTCPNCGAKMAADVNFCTSCGTDLRNIKVDAANQTQSTQSDVKPQPEVKEAPKATSNPNPEGQNNTNPQPNLQPNPQPNGTSSNAFSQAIRGFDARNMWAWFVNSWKHPFAEQNANKWYGWITLIAEDILFGLGAFIYSQRAINSIFGGYASGSGGVTFGIMFELIIFVALAQLAWIGAAYLAYKVIYGKSKDFLQFTNHVVQTSNLSAIFIVVYFVFMALLGPAGIVMSYLMIVLATSFFSMALTVVILGDPNPVHDKFYGYFLFIVLQVITGFILFMVIGGTLMAQIGSMFGL